MGFNKQMKKNHTAVETKQSSTREPSKTSFRSSFTKRRNSFRNSLPKMKFKIKKTQKRSIAKSESEFEEDKFFSNFPHDCLYDSMALSELEDRIPTFIEFRYGADDYIDDDDDDSIDNMRETYSQAEDSITRSSYMSRSECYGINNSPPVSSMENIESYVKKIQEDRCAAANSLPRLELPSTKKHDLGKTGNFKVHIASSLDCDCLELPTSSLSWKAQFISIGGILGTPSTLHIYNTKLDYEDDVNQSCVGNISTQKLDLMEYEIVDRAQGLKSVQYHDQKEEEWRCFILIPKKKSSTNVAIQIASENCVEIKNIFVTISRIMLNPPSNDNIQLTQKTVEDSNVSYANSSRQSYNSHQKKTSSEQKKRGNRHRRSFSSASFSRSLKSYWHSVSFRNSNRNCRVAQ